MDVTCELCGALKVATRIVVVDRAEVRACKMCVERTGRTWEQPRPTTSPSAGAGARRKRQFSGGYSRTGKSGRDIMMKDVEELVHDFSSRIKSARELRGWDQREFARSAAETINVIQRIESGKPAPDDTMRKIGKLLDIELFVTRQESTPVTRSVPGQGMTLGDLLDLTEMRSDD